MKKAALFFLIFSFLTYVRFANGYTAWIKYNGPGNWSDSANWSSGEPASTTEAWLNNGGTAQITEPNEVCGTLRFATTSGGNGTLEQTSGSLVAAQVHIGTSGSGGGYRYRCYSDLSAKI
jgi:hypothetical protein